MPISIEDKKRYARNCIVKAYLDWDHYRIAPTDGCFDGTRGECNLRQRKTPSRPKQPVDCEASDVTLYDVCGHEELFDVTGNRKDVTKFDEEIKDYVDRFITERHIEKHALPGSKGPFR